MGNTFCLICLIGTTAVLGAAICPAQGLPPEKATDVTVTVLREGTRSGPLSGATVRLSYPRSASQEAISDSSGAVRFRLPVDASLVSLSISHPQFPDWVNRYIQWQRQGSRASTRVVLRDAPPFPLKITVVSCSGSPREICSAADGYVTLYRRGDAAAVGTMPIRGGQANIDLRFPPTELELLAYLTDGSLTYVVDPTPSYLGDVPTLNLVIRKRP